jgi:drug/metabolite transporter (DMT)-like permease
VVSAPPDPAHPERNPRLGFALALASTIILSANTVLGKFALGEDGFNPATFGLLWMGSACAYCLLTLAARRRLRELIMPSRLLAAMVVVSLLTGAVQFFGWTGLSLLDPSFAGFLNRFGMVFIILGSVLFLGERLTRWEVAAFVLMTAGGLVSAVSSWENTDTRTGILCILASTLAIAAQRILIKVRLARVDALVTNFYRTLGGAAVIGGWAFATGAARFDAGAGPWAAVLIGAFLGPCLSVWMTYAAYRVWDLSRCTLLVMLQPLLILPGSYVFLDMLPSRMQFVGGLLILAGALALVWLHGRARRTARREGEGAETEERRWKATR